MTGATASATAVRWLGRADGAVPPTPDNPVTSAPTRSRAYSPSMSKSGSKTVTSSPMQSGLADESAQEQLQLRVGDAAGVGRVDRRHHRRVEHVDVEVHPEADALRRAARGPTGPSGAAPWARRSGDATGRRSRRPAGPCGTRRWARRPTSTTSLSRTYGPALLDAGEVGLAPAGDQGERLARGRARPPCALPGCRKSEWAST